MTSAAHPLPASMAPFLAGFELVRSRLERLVGFVLLPVEVPGPDVATALGDFLTGRGHPAVVIEPRDDAAWMGLLSTLLDARPAPEGVVMLIGTTEESAAMRAGLRLVNQRRDTLSRQLGCPLLWCGSAGFLDLTWQTAPDFWSIRAIDQRLVEEENPPDTRSPEPRSPPSSSPPPSPSGASEEESKRLRRLFLAAREQGDHASATRLASRLVDALLAENSVDEAARVVDDVLAVVGDGALTADLLLRRAAIERRLGHAFTAAATLGALQARPDTPPPTRLRAHLAMASLYEEAGDLVSAESTYRKALDLARSLAEPEAQARALVGAFGIAARTDRSAEAEAPLAEARAIAQRLGDLELESTAVAAQALAAAGGHDRRRSVERLAEAGELHDESTVARREEGTSPSSEAWPPIATEPVDVLILTALQDELEGVLTCGGGGRGGWQERRDLGGFRYFRRTLPRVEGGSLCVAAAWIGEMGERTATLRGQQLLTELDPDCLAMCGICAGFREKVGLGDVIVADRLFSYDEGKRVAEPGKEASHFHDLRTFDLQATWKMDAAYLGRELDLSALSRERPPSKEAQRRWLLHSLHAHETGGGPPPATHPDRRRACPAWTERLKEALAGGLVTLEAGQLRLTDTGREQVLDDQVLHPDGLPPDPPLRVHVGAIATVKTVQQDPSIFDHLRRLVRTTLGLEMEGTAIGDLAARFERRAILVKAVVDFADQDKDDSFRTFACRASAEVLLAFLQRHWSPGRPGRGRPAGAGPFSGERGPHGRSDFAEPRRRGDRDERALVFLEDQRGGFLSRVERVALLRDPGATVTRHEAPHPFAGFLEFAVREGSLVDVRVLGALEMEIDESRVAQFLTHLDDRFRWQAPFLRAVLVHTGPPAPVELARNAQRRGVVLQSFAEYQGLIDFTRYLVWQTGRLEADNLYPKWLYVDQPALVSHAGGREEQATESALRAIWELLDAPDPRFALVLGDFGAGKTFLLHELARRMAHEKGPLVPVLVEMSKLEKQRALKALLAQHFAVADVGRIDLDAFQYMLGEGRIALLFDGFDELAQRITYERAVEHFETVIQAARGRAKVVVTSRTQHFLTDQQVRRALAERAEHVPGYRLFRLEPFGEGQIRTFLGNLFPAREEAEDRLRLIGEVKDLLGLSANPRMLGFIAALDRDKLEKARSGTDEISAARLYGLLVDQWLDFEHARTNPRGAPCGIARPELRKAMTEVAALLWHRPAKTVEIHELPDSLIAAVQSPTGPGTHAAPLERGVVEHLIGSGSLLVRDTEGMFSFVHRSVLEWLIADAAAEAVKAGGDPLALGADEMSDLMIDFFVSLAGRESAEAWALGKVASPEDGATKKNAARVWRHIKLLRDGGETGKVERPLALNFEAQHFRGQDFSRVDWRQANLTRADLRGATLVEARLSGATLIEANLSRADLSRADLTGVDMTGTDLSFARLTGANLRGVKGLDRAQLRGASFVAARGVGDVEGLVAAGAAPPAPVLEPMWLSGALHHAVAWSPLGDLVASGHSEGTVSLTDPVSVQVLRILKGHSERVLCLAFSPDGRWLASGARDMTIRLWEVGTGKVVRSLRGQASGVTALMFCPDGKTLISGEGRGFVRLWDLVTGSTLQCFEGHSDVISSVAVSSDGCMLATASRDESVRLWELTTGRLLTVLEGQEGGPLGIAFALQVQRGTTVRDLSEFNSKAAPTEFRSLLRTGEIRRWLLPEFQQLPSRIIAGLSAEQLPLTDAAFGAAGGVLAVASGSGVYMLSPLNESVVQKVEPQGQHCLPARITTSPEGQIAAAGVDLSLLDPMSGMEVGWIEARWNWVGAVAFQTDGRRMIIAYPPNGVWAWDLGSGVGTWSVPRLWSGGHALAFDQGGNMLASLGQAHIRVRGVTDRQLDRSWGIREWEGGAGITFSPDGLTLAAAEGKSGVGLWKIPSGAPLRHLGGHEGAVMSLAFHPGGTTLCSGAEDAAVRLWEVATGKLIRVLRGPGAAIDSVAFSPDGRCLAAGSWDRTIRLWDPSTGDTLRVLHGHEGAVSSLLFSPDSRNVASGAADGTVRLWDAADIRPPRMLEGHVDTVSALCFSTDGRLLASGSRDGTSRLWHVATGRCLAIFLGSHEGWVAFTPDGRFKSDGDLDGVFWHVAGLRRFEPGEVDPYLERPLRVPGDEPLFSLPAAESPEHG